MQWAERDMQRWKGVYAARTIKPPKRNEKDVKDAAHEAMMMDESQYVARCLYFQSETFLVLHHETRLRSNKKKETRRKMSKKKAIPTKFTEKVQQIQILDKRDTQRKISGIAPCISHDQRLKKENLVTIASRLV